MEASATTDSVKFSPYYCVCEDSMNPSQAEGEDVILQCVTPFETGSLFEQKKAALKFIGERLLYIYGRHGEEGIRSGPSFDFDTYTIKGYIVTNEGNFPMFYWSNDSGSSFKPWYLAEEFADETEYLRKHVEAAKLTS